MIGALQSKWCMDLLLKTIGKVPFVVVKSKPEKKTSFIFPIPTEVIAKTKLSCGELSFASSGWMQIFQCGVAKYIQENYEYEDCHMVGTSGGALIACALCCDISMDTIFGEMIKTRKIYNNNIFMMCDYTKINIKKMLPKTCIELINNRLTIVCSKFKDFSFTPMYKNAFATYEDVVKYLYATIHIPIMDGCLPHEVDGQLLYDGLLTDSHPQISADCIHVNWDRTCNKKQNIIPEIAIPVHWCIFPPDERILHLLYCHGYYQAQIFFQKKDSPENVNAENILSELKEEMIRDKRTQELISITIYVIKGGFIFCGCFLISNMVL